MPDPVERLAELAALLPSETPDPREIRERARRRVRRRRVLAALPVAAVLALVVAGVWALDAPDPETVIVDSPTTTSEPTAPTESLPPGFSPSGLRAVPVLELLAGDTITVWFDVPAEADGAHFMAVCDGEVVNRAYDGVAQQDLLQWCGEPVEDPPNPTELTVHRFVETPEGLIDCAANVGRCVVAAALEVGTGRGSAPMRWSPLGFTAVEQGPLTVEIGAEGQVHDGQVIVVSGEGGLPGQSVVITQCLDERGWRNTEDYSSCDTIRHREARVDRSGRYTARFIVYREILTYSPDGSEPSRWTPCEPCFLFVSRSNHQGEPVAVPIQVAETQQPIRARIDIVEPGPYSPGQRVTLRASGFQPEGRPRWIELCSSSMVSRPFEADCTPHDTVDSGRPIGPTGGFTIEEYELPSAEFTTRNGTRCSASGACAFGATLGEGIALLLSEPLEIRE